MNSGSANNKMYQNTIINSKSHAIILTNGSSGNAFYSNKIVSATPQGKAIGQDVTSKNNSFSNNQIVSSKVSTAERKIKAAA